MMWTELVGELIQALDVEGQSCDANDYTPLDLLLYRSRSEEKTASDLLGLLRASISDVIETSNNPGALVDLIVGMKVSDAEMADGLEHSITTGRFIDAGKRLAALTILRACGRVLPPRYIVNDENIRKLAPLQWLDLSLPVLDAPEARQDAILSLVKIGALAPSHMLPRLHGIWTAGGSDPVAFLKVIASHIGDDDKADFVTLINENFDLSLKPGKETAALAKPLARVVRIPHQLEKRGAKVTKVDEQRLKQHKNDVRRNSVVPTFPEFDRQNASAA